MPKRDIVERLRDPMVEVDYDDRLMVADQPANARLKIEQQANRIDELEAEVARLREELKALKNDDWPERL
jgi:hypothetical protein